MPVSASGVMLVLWMTPNGVSIGLPPALRTPFADAWHTAQLPSAASSLPRAIVAAEKTAASGRAIGAIARHGSTAAPMPTAAAQSAAMLANTPLRLTNGFFHMSERGAGAGGFYLTADPPCSARELLQNLSPAY